MSDDRSPMDDWFRDDRGEPSASSEPNPPFEPYGGWPRQPQPEMPTQPLTPQPRPSGTGSNAWDDYRNNGSRNGGGQGSGTGNSALNGMVGGGNGRSADDAPTQIGGLSPTPQPQAQQPRVPQQSQQPLAFPQYQQAERATVYGQSQGMAPQGVGPQGLGPQAQAPRGPRLDQGPVNGGGYGNGEFQPRPHDDQGEPPRRNRKPLIAGTAVIGVLVLGMIAYLALGNSSSNPKSSAGGAAASPSPTHTSFQPTSANPAIAAEQTATAFLNAWQSGDLQTAAKYTDNPTGALAALNDYKSGLGLSALTLKPQPAVVAAPSPSVAAGGVPVASAASSGSGSGSASGAPTAAAANPSGTVPFSATATVQLASQSATGQSVTAVTASPAPNTPQTWSYTSSMVAYKQSDGWSVRWSPSILAPNLADGQKLSIVSVPAGVGKVVDSSGANLSTYPEGALANINTSLGKKAPPGQGTPGIAVQIVDPSGKPVGAATATLLKPVDAPELKTTIDPAVESLARAAVAMNPRSSMVVLRPSTGAILAVANTPGSGDTALTGGLAPGSTFKIVTSAAVLSRGIVSVNTPVACPLTVTVQGVVYHNASNGPGTKEESYPPNTPFITDFAQSCNNAFTPFYQQLEGGKLADTASTYFGLTQPWDIGLGPSTYFSIPGDSSGAELAQEDFGQGQVVTSPLAMASVAATVGTGAFKQPYLVDGLTKATATPLPSGTDADLKTLMHAVVTEGTAAGVFNGAPGTVYAKTGTAETDANKDKKNNAWMVAYDGQLDVAVGVVVQDSGFGAVYAGPEAEYVLSHM